MMALDRVEHDYYPTPPRLTHALIDQCHMRLVRLGQVLELERDRRSVPVCLPDEWQCPAALFGFMTTPFFLALISFSAVLINPSSLTSEAIRLAAVDARLIQAVRTSATDEDPDAQCEWLGVCPKSAW